MEFSSFSLRDDPYAELGPEVNKNKLNCHLLLTPADPQPDHPGLGATGEERLIPGVLRVTGWAWPAGWGRGASSCTPTGPGQGIKDSLVRSDHTLSTRVLLEFSLDFCI